MRFICTIVTVILITFYFFLLQVSVQENVAGAQIRRSAATRHVIALQFRLLFGGKAYPPAGPLVKIEDAPRNVYGLSC